MGDSLFERRVTMGLSFKPTVWLIMGRAVGFPASFLVTVVLVRLLDPVEFGTYKQLLLIYTTLYAIAQFGMAESLFYFLPLAPQKSAGYALNSILFLAAAGLLGLGFLQALAADIGRWLSNQQLVDYITLLGVYLLLMTSSAALEIVMIGRNRYRGAAVCYALSDGVRALCFVLPVLLLQRLEWLLLGAVGFAAIRLGGQLLYLRREFQGLLRPDWTLLKEQLAYALPFGLGVPFAILQANFHQYAVSHYFDTATFAIYAVGCFQIPFVDFVASSAGIVMMVKMSEKIRDGQAGAVLTIWQDTTLKLAVVLFPIVGWALVVAPELVIVLFSQTYQASVPIFMILSVTILLSVLPTDGVIRVYARTRFALVLSVVRFLLIVTLIGRFLSVFQLYGAALATVVVAMVDKLLGLARVRGLLQVGLFQLLPWRRLTGVFGAAAVPALAVLVLKSELALPPSVSLSMVSLFYAAGYLALLYGLGLLNEGDRLAIRGWLKRLTASAG